MFSFLLQVTFQRSSATMCSLFPRIAFKIGPQPPIGYACRVGLIAQHLLPAVISLSSTPPILSASLGGRAVWPLHQCLLVTGSIFTTYVCTILESQIGKNVSEFGVPSLYPGSGIPLWLCSELPDTVTTSLTGLVRVFRDSRRDFKGMRLQAFEAEQAGIHSMAIARHESRMTLPQGGDSPLPGTGRADPPYICKGLSAGFLENAVGRRREIYGYFSYRPNRHQFEHKHIVTFQRASEIPAATGI